MTGRRRGTTLVELLVALSLVGLFLGVFWAVRSSGNREGDHVERRSELMTAVTLVQEALAWDLQRSLSLTSIPDEDLAAGVERTSITLPVYAGYEGAEEAALRYQALVYRFDRESRILYRGSTPLLVHGLEDASFRWTEDRPTMLVVTLTGRTAFGGPKPTVTVRIPAPAGTNGLGTYRLARHHRLAERSQAPVVERKVAR